MFATYFTSYLRPWICVGSTSYGNDQSEILCNLSLLGTKRDPKGYDKTNANPGLINGTPPPLNPRFINPGSTLYRRPHAWLFHVLNASINREYYNEISTDMMVLVLVTVCARGMKTQVQTRNVVSWHLTTCPKRSLSEKTIRFSCGTHEHVRRQKLLTCSKWCLPIGDSSYWFSTIY